MNSREAEQVALLQARTAGCDCEPNLTLVAIDDGIGHLRVAHDAWCRLLREQGEHRAAVVDAR